MKTRTLYRCALGAKFIGRSICLWGHESNLLSNFERARRQVPEVLKDDPDRILEACIFEIVTSQVDQVPVPDWAFTAMGMPVEKRNFRYGDMLYTDGRRRDQWGKGAFVPDVSNPETRLWFYFLAWWASVFAKAPAHGAQLSQARPHPMARGMKTPSGRSGVRVSSIRENELFLRSAYEVYL